MKAVLAPIIIIIAQVSAGIQSFNFGMALADGTLDGKCVFKRFPVVFTHYPAIYYSVFERIAAFLRSIDKSRYSWQSRADAQ
jgi:hypothetical protein